MKFKNSWKWGYSNIQHQPHLLQLNNSYNAMCQWNIVFGQPGRLLAIAYYRVDCLPIQSSSECSHKRIVYHCIWTCLNAHRPLRPLVPDWRHSQCLNLLLVCYEMPTGPLKFLKKTSEIILFLSDPYVSPTPSVFESLNHSVSYWVIECPFLSNTQNGWTVTPNSRVVWLKRWRKLFRVMHFLFVFLFLFLILMCGNCRKVKIHSIQRNTVYMCTILFRGLGVSEVRG